MILDKFNFFIKKFHTKHINKDKNSIIKCPLSNIDNNGECNCIPVITKSKFHIWFHCENHKNIKYIELNTYLFLTNIDKIFIKGPRKINETNLSENIKFIQENSVKSKFKLGINKVNQNSGSFIVQIKAKLDEKIKDLNNFLMIYKDNKNFDETFKIQSMLNIKNTYFHFSKMLSIYIYFIIIKRLINELHDTPFDIKNKIMILKNLGYASDFLVDFKMMPFKSYFEKGLPKKSKKKNKNKKNNKDLKFYWIIEFYLEEEKKYEDDNKNVFISVNEKGIISIFKLNFFKSKNQLSNNEKKNFYEFITSKVIPDFKPIKITKLKNLFNQKENDNYFLINSKNLTTIGKAIIINVIENNNSEQKDRYKFEIVQTIKDINGLYSSYEISFKGKNYLLDFYKVFYIWKLNPEKNQLEYEIIGNEIIEDSQKYNYGPLIYEESKKLFIIQCFSPNVLIEFYQFIEENENFRIIKLDNNIKFNEDQSVLKSNNNYFIYKNKYLLLASGKNKNNSFGGIYIIDLDEFKIIMHQTFLKYKSIYCIIPSKIDNIFICSSVFCTNKIKKIKKCENDKTNNYNINRGRLLLVEIEEKEDKISLKILKHLEGGDNYYINCNKLFFDEYFFTSMYENNSLIKFHQNMKKFSRFFKMVNNIKNN